MITLIGALVNFSCLLVILLHDLSYSKDLPSWAYVYIALGILVYQGLDDLDGIHARNLRMSSPLGLLCDHGIDAVLEGVIVISQLETLQAGSGWSSVSSIILYTVCGKRRTST